VTHLMRRSSNARQSVACQAIAPDMRTGLLAAVTLTVGCAVSRQDILAEFKAQVLPRAAFELNCPVEQLSSDVLTTDESKVNGYAATVGVRGCGSRYVYIKAYPTGWVLNSTQAERGSK